MKIAFLSKTDVTIDAVKETFVPYTVIVCRDRKELLKEIPQIDVLVAQNVGFQFHTIDADVLSLGKNLRLIQHFGVAWDATDAKEAGRLNIPVATIAAQNSNGVAEQTFHLVLSLAKKAREAYRATQTGEMGNILTTELSGKSICIVGLGKIGKILVRMAKAFNMHVIGVKKTPDFDAVLQAGVDSAHTSNDLHQLLPLADFVVLAIPLNKDTFDLINHAEFKVMKAGAGLINISRGPNVNKEALMQALADGKICGFASDVFWQEPADPDDPLLKDDRVIYTPHLGGYSDFAVYQSAEAVKDNIDRLAKGEPVLNVVNL
jgi:phosphoglycerate dehydrogenase-like enzyme